MTAPIHILEPATKPDAIVNAKKVFNIDLSLEIPAYKNAENSPLKDFIPEKDPHYRFDTATTRAILAGFVHNRRVMIQGYHGTGKSSHIEQVAAYLNWPALRINLDGHIGRIDLIGRDAIVLQDGQQVTTFREGVVPWAMEHGVALIFDEYDAGRPDVMFVLQRLLENEGRLTLAEQNRVVRAHPAFRLFATANTVGQGDVTGLYHGTNPVNQGQMDRWNIVSQLNYLPQEQEEAIIRAKVPTMDKNAGTRKEVTRMVMLANLTRAGFAAGDISIVMSPRTVIHWAENLALFDNTEDAFRVSFLNKCLEDERPAIAEYYQRALGVQLPELTTQKT